MEFRVENMTCGHCVRAVTEAIRRLDPKADVSAELEAGRLHVNSTADKVAIVAALAEEGYPASPL